MVSENEIKAMLTLLDDSDDEVRQHIEDQFLSIGLDIVPQLELLWENQFNPILQESIVQLIHKIQFKSIKESLELWHLKGTYDLLEGLMIINRYQFPDIDEQKIINNIEEIKRDAWLMMNNDMNPEEQIKTLNHIFYAIHGFKGNTGNHSDPQNSYISQVIESKKGNQILLASIYSIIAQRLDIPVFGVNLPQHFVLAYVDNTQIADYEKGVLFYINAFNKGFIFKRRDIDFFLRQLKLEPKTKFYEPCNNIDIMQRVLRNLIHSYQQLGHKEKVDELYGLFDIINPNTPSDTL